jgi:hypothetical protein
LLFSRDGSVNLTIQSRVAGMAGMTLSKNRRQADRVLREGADVVVYFKLAADLKTGSLVHVI